MQHKRSLRCLGLLLVSLGVFLIAGFITMVGQSPVAYAHAFVTGSDPVDGSTVASAPTAVRIFFNAPISSASVAYVFAPVPNQYGQLQLVNAGHSSVSRTNSQELDTPLAHVGVLPQGSYEVRWTALANDDGHTTSGIIGFDVGHSSLGLPGEVILGPSTSNYMPQLDAMGILSVAWEWLVLMALTFWIGIIVTEELILKRADQTANLLARAYKHALPLQWLCLSALLAGEIINLILRATHFTQASTGGGLDLSALFQIITASLYGYLWLARIVLIALAMGLLWWTTRATETARKKTNRTETQQSPMRRSSNFSRLRQRVTQEHNTTVVTGATGTTDVTKELPVEREQESPSHTMHTTRQSYTIVWLALTALLLFTYALASDAAQLAQPHISAIVLDWLFLVARSIWLGGLTYLGYVLLPLLKVAEPDQHAAILVTVLRRFTPLILAAIGVVLVTGLYLSESSMSSTQQLLTNPFGRILLVELALGAVLLALSLYTLFYLRSKLARQMALLPVVNAELPARRARQSALGQTEQGMKQFLVVQSWLGAAILLCAALMAFFAPPIVFPNIDYAAQARAAAPTQIVGITQTKQVGNLSVTLQVLPGRYNYTNSVIVTINDSSDKPVSDARVEISANMELMDMGTTRVTVSGGNPTYIATFSPKSSAAFSMPGLWDISLNIQRPGQAPLQTTFQVVLGQ